MRSIRISEDVWRKISENGVFGETPDDVLKRILGIDKQHEEEKDKHMNAEKEAIIEKDLSPDKAEALFSKVKNRDLLDFLVKLIGSLDRMKKQKSVTNEFKFWFDYGASCCVYIRPASEHLHVFIADLAPWQVQDKISKFNLRSEDNPGNPNDQFNTKIRIDGKWVLDHAKERDALIETINAMLP